MANQVSDEQAAIERLRQAMKNRSYSIETMSAELEVHRNTIANVLHGRVPFDRRTVIACAYVLGVDADWLRYGTVNEETAPVSTGAVGVHPLGLEPRTHCFRVDTVDELIEFWDSVTAPLVG